MKGKYLWKAMDSITPSSRVVDSSNVWLGDDVGDGRRLFGISDTHTPGNWSSLYMLEISGVWLLIAISLVTLTGKFFVNCNSTTVTAVTPLALVFTPTDHTMYSNASSIIYTITDTRALVRFACTHQPLGINARHLVDFELYFLWNLIQQQHRPPICVLLPLVLAATIVPTETVFSHLTAVAPQARSFPGAASLEDEYMSLGTYPITSHVVRYKVWVIMAEGWRLYTGARIVNGHIAYLLGRISQARFRRSINRTGFDCCLAVQQLDDYINLELTPTSKIGEAVTWYLQLLTWYIINKNCHSAIEGRSPTFGPLAHALRVPRLPVPITSVDNMFATLHQSVVDINSPDTPSSNLRVSLRTRLPLFYVPLVVKSAPALPALPAPLASSDFSAPPALPASPASPNPPASSRWWDRCHHIKLMVFRIDCILIIAEWLSDHRMKG
ncbi:hypothetical protein FRC03_009116 [Tulasnella sp. 419]|nr:hypothetical protein FRC02_009036 [Tulasnella sp. 418]KAG8958448.1 hypothetical protein FRC03_009116 [Tulasnella sp. 419]